MFYLRLRQLRASKKLTMRNAAKLIGVPESTYRDWEYGREIRGEPYPQIAKAFGVTLDELFGVATMEDSSIEQTLDNVISELEFIRQKVKNISR